MTGSAGTRLPDWRSGPPGPASVTVPAVDATRATAALLRVVALLAGETEVAVGRVSAGGVPELVRVTPGGTAVSPVDGPVEVGLALGAAGPAGWAATEVSLAGGRLTVRADPGRFDASWSERVAGYLARALAGDADLVGAEERGHLVHGRGGPVRPLPDRPYGTLVAERAARHPDRVAVAYEGRAMSYGELDAAANRVARGLLAAGLEAEDTVAVGTDRTSEWVAAILGVFRAGGVYLPVEPEHPAERVATVLERSGCRFVLTESGGLAGTGARWSRTVAELLAAGGTGPPDVTIAPEQAAYVYFTSGSTGTPKGALCEHRGMANHLAAKIEDLGLGADDVVVQNAEQSFDISLWQLAAPLLVGARVLVVPRRDI
ncbi:MAG TPA: AMP-binding protein, partial [Mycobacteriales bacterium]